jgi:DNA primase large subunit
MGDTGVQSMNKPLSSAEIGRSSETEIERDIHELARGSVALRRTEKGDDEISGDSLGTLIRRMSETSTREIENLLSELQTLRKKLQNDGDRIQREIAEYTDLSQQVMQLTTIISESVKKLPDTSGMRH